MQSRQADDTIKTTRNKPTHIVHAMMERFGDPREALGSVSGWDWAAYISAAGSYRHQEVIIPRSAFVSLQGSIR